MPNITTERTDTRCDNQTRTDCRELIERVTMRSDGEWEITRTYTYANGTSQVEEDDFGGWYFVPASPGWEVITENYEHGQLGFQREPIEMWRFLVGDDHSCLFPVTPGSDVGRPIAVISPDARIYEVVNERGEVINEYGPDQEFPSVESWVAHIADMRVKRLAEEKERLLQRERCSHCGAYKDENEIPFG
jgi:hypothetical protein